jgi:tRNA A-37 threonylcarbamoyl transferase component Bud32
VTLLRRGPVSEVRRVGAEGGPARFEKRYAVAWPWLPLAGLLKGNVPALDARAEARNAERLLALGIAAPRPLATAARWRISGLSLVRETTVELAEVPGTSLDKVLCDAKCDRRMRRAIAADLGRLVATMHSAAIFHRDLYLCHVLRDETSGRLGLIDVARAAPRRLRRERWRAKDLGALLLSSRGLAGRGDRVAFLRSYLGVARLPRAARPLVARAIAKAAALERRGRKS